MVSTLLGRGRVSCGDHAGPSVPFRENNEENTSVSRRAKSTLASLSPSIVCSHREGAGIKQDFLGLFRFDTVVSDMIDVTIVPIKHVGSFPPRRQYMP